MYLTILYLTFLVNRVFNVLLFLIGTERRYIKCFDAIYIHTFAMPEKVCCEITVMLHLDLLLIAYCCYYITTGCLIGYLILH